MYEKVVNAINVHNWDFLRKMVPDEKLANNYIEDWVKHPVHIGKLLQVENDVQWQGMSCAKYSFAMEYADGKSHPHWLQILIHEDGEKLTIPDFWEFGW